jgi:hypothetical protein
VEEDTTVKAARQQGAAGLAEARRAAAEKVRRGGLLTDLDAARVWARTDGILPAASVSPGVERAAVYAELGEALSGAWRFVLGTALAVETAEQTDEAGTAQVEESDLGFRRFLAGGGSVSFAAMRPVAMHSGSYADQLLFAVPRLWTNMPTLTPAEGINDYGGEMAAEYQYRRYARRMLVPGDTLGSRAETPFLILQVRGGLVSGSNPFYRAIGRSELSSFPYVVPTLNLQFENGVRIGASWFYGFGAFTEHEALRFHVTLAPVSRERPSPPAGPSRTDAGSPAGGS